MESIIEYTELSKFPLLPFGKTLLICLNMSFLILFKVSVMDSHDEALENWTDDSFEEPSVTQTRTLCPKDGKLF